MLFFVSGSGQMLARGEFRPTDQDTLEFRRKALRDAVMCIGWLKFFSLICYMLLYALVHVNSKEGSMNVILEVMILVVIPLQIFHSIILILGAYWRSFVMLYISLALFIVVGSYNTVLGIMGAIHYIKTGYLTMHFVLIVVFLLLALSLITVVCHDIFIVLAYIRFLKSGGATNASFDPKSVNTRRTPRPKDIIQNV